MTTMRSYFSFWFLMFFGSFEEQGNIQVCCLQSVFHATRTAYMHSLPAVKANL